MRIARVLSQLVLILTAALAIAGETPRAALIKGMERRFESAATMIQTQSLGEKGGLLLQLKVEINTLGHQRSTVLKPLSLQGMVSFDDRKQWVSIMPDDKKAFIQPSPATFRAPARERIVLVDRNYELSFEKSSPIAGRKIILIVAAPKFSDMAKRKIYLDEESHMLLRLEIIDRSGATKRMLDTMSIEYQKGAAVRSLNLNLKGYDVNRMAAPRPGSDPSLVKAAVGFTPKKVGTLPCGFVITDVQLIGDGDDAMLAFRLTDGLSMVTVYQFDKKRNKEASKMWLQTFAEDQDGIRTGVMGDAPDSVCRAIRDVFVGSKTARP